MSNYNSGSSIQNITHPSLHTRANIKVNCLAYKYLLVFPPLKTDL